MINVGIICHRKLIETNSHQPELVGFKEKHGKFIVSLGCVPPPRMQSWHMKVYRDQGIPYKKYSNPGGGNCILGRVGLEN